MITRMSCFFFLFSILFAASADTHEDFLQCLSQHSPTSNLSNIIYTQNDLSYFSVLNFSTQNPRFSSPSTPRPLVIVTPTTRAHVQTTVRCSKKHRIQIRTRSGGHDSKKHRIQIRTRSGGHDYEGLSYVSYTPSPPFVVIDLINLRSISVNVEDQTAWVEAGATIGEVYHKIAEKSTTLGFPSAIAHTVGVGGLFSGGGYGNLLRKYGLSADHIIDARLVDVHGRVLGKETMGEDLFWAIRGGGGVSFGVVLAWKIGLVPVPSTVTVFTVNRNLEQNATELVHRWQFVADKFAEDLFILIRLQAVTSSTNNNKTIQASFISLFLGGVNRLLLLMHKSFPELGLKRENCIEMSWIESVLYFAGFPVGVSRDALLQRTPQIRLPFKGKSDYVKEPIPLKGLEGIWERLYEEDVGRALMQMTPYGGKMREISESEIPFPHRAGNIYKILYLVGTSGEQENVTQNTHIDWIRRLYSYMAIYVSKNPRAAYLNYRDLDIGTYSKNGSTMSYAKASVWGYRYFKNNFERLVRVKTRVDSTNFFWNEQSIPSLIPQLR